MIQTIGGFNLRNNTHSQPLASSPSAFPAISMPIVHPEELNRRFKDRHTEQYISNPFAEAVEYYEQPGWACSADPVGRLIQDRPGFLPRNASCKLNSHHPRKGNIFQEKRRLENVVGHVVTSSRRCFRARRNVGGAFGLGHPQVVRSPARPLCHWPCRGAHIPGTAPKGACN